MARSPAEIHADIAVTRRVIERQLDALGHAVEGRWWAPYAVIAGGFAVGFGRPGGEGAVRPVWKGALTFGLVTIPVGLYPATAPAGRRAS